MYSDELCEKETNFLDGIEINKLIHKGKFIALQRVLISKERYGIKREENDNEKRWSIVGFPSMKKEKRTKGDGFNAVCWDG